MSVLRSAVTAAAGLALSLMSPALAGGGVSITSYGQRSLLIQGGGQSVLLNPYVCESLCVSVSSGAVRVPGAVPVGRCHWHCHVPAP